VNNCGGWLTPRRRSLPCRSRRLIMNGRCRRRPWRGCWTRSRPPPPQRRRRGTARTGSGCRLGRAPAVPLALRWQTRVPSPLLDR